jgi:hypothetical protein
MAITIPDGYNTRPHSHLLDAVLAGARTNGNVFYVHGTNGTDSAGYGSSPTSPFKTTDYAVGQCTANNGDVIICLPGHTETLGADSAVDVDIAGITIIGMGYGADRPTFNASAVAGDFKLAAASTVIMNLLFTGGIDETTGIIEVSAADCKIIDCEYRDVTGQATDILITTAAADRLLIDNFKVIGAAAAGSNSAIALVGADDCEIKDTYIYGNFAVSAIDLRTTKSERVNIHDCKIWTANAADIAIKDTVAASTGWIGPNLQIMLAENAANITEAVTGATFQYVDPIYVCNLAGEKAMLTDITASTNA